MLDRGYADEVLAAGLGAGLDAAGIAPASAMLRARQALEERRARGLHAGMAFTYKNPVRSTTPEAAVRGAQAMVVGARAYLTDEPPAPSGPCGRVGRYAWADHYAPLRAALWVVARRLRADGWRAVVFADDNSVVDREAAWLAGIGWFGKNANLLLPGHGSWFVLGSVVTDAPLPVAPQAVPDGCGPCHRCVDACPTGAIVAPGVVDAGRCLAWLLQRPGVFPLEHREALGDRLYGCDDCQEVCPPTVRGEPARPAPEGAVAQVAVLDLLDAADAELLARHGRWYLHDRDPRWLRHDALVVLGNTGDAADGRTLRVLQRYVEGPDALLAEHARWAHRQVTSRSPVVA